MTTRALLLLALSASTIGCRHGAVRETATGTRPLSPPVATVHAPVCETLRPYLDSVHAGGRAPALAVGIALPDGSSCGIAVGRADTSRQIPLAASSLLLTGSVGKTYVAAVALQLVAEGRLELDAPISRYLAREPWFDRVANARAITVRHLMTHASGIVRYEFDPRFLADLKAAPMRTWTPADRIAYLLDKPAPFAPGAGWEYSDTNYIVLGLILERITGRALNDEIARRVLVPLGLRETRPSDRPVIEGLAQGYAGAGNEFVEFDAMLDANGRMRLNPQFEWAGGGYASTPRDLARWMTDYFEGRAYPDSLVRIATTGIAARGLGAGASYGLGVIIRPSPTGMTWGHSGFFPGYLTEARYWPAHRIAVTLQINSSVNGVLGRAPGQVVNEIARRLGASGGARQ